MISQTTVNNKTIQRPTNPAISIYFSYKDEESKITEPGIYENT